MGWLWPKINDEAGALRALHSAAMIPVFGAAYCVLLSLHQNPLLAGCLVALALGVLARAIQRASRLAVYAALGLLVGVVFLQPHLFLGWICLYLMAVYGVRGAFGYRKAAARTRSRPESFTTLVMGWLWPEIADGPAAVRAIQRESLLVFWLGMEMAWIHGERHHYLMSAFVLWATLALLFALSRGSRVAAVLAVILLGAMGPVFLPVFPLRPQHLLAIPLALCGIRGTLAFHYFRRWEGRRAFDEEPGAEPAVARRSSSLRI
jgi:hypothetical protein